MTRAWAVALAWLLPMAALGVLVGMALAHGGDDAPGQAPIHHQQTQMHESAGRAGPVLATVDIDGLGGPWQTVALPYTFRNPAVQGERNRMQTRWFRLTLPGPTQTSQASTHLYLVRWQVAGHIAVYGDGRLIYRSHGNPASNLTRQRSLALLLNAGDASPVPHDILIRLDSMSGTAGGLSSVYTGASAEVLSRYAQREWLQNRLPEAGSVACLAMGLLSLLVWWRRRTEKLFLFVALYAALHGVRQWLLLTDLPQMPGTEDGGVTFVLINLRVWQLVATHFIMVELHGVVRPRFHAGVLAFGLGFTLLTGLAEFLGAQLLGLRPLWLGLTLVLSLLIVGSGLYHSRTVRSGDGALLGVVLLVNTALAIYDALKVNLLLPLEWLPLYPYTIGIYTVTLMFIMTRRYTAAMRQVEQANLHLAERVREREDELDLSYQRLREVEHQQTLANERRRLMQDMHDGIGASLTGAIRVVDEGAADKAAVGQLLRDCLDELKLTIDSMETADPDLPLLLGALRFRLGAHIEAAGIALVWNVDRLPPLDWLEPSLALNILRILQESIANVLRHTRATELRITATTADRQGREGVEVVVQDNGAGFAVDEALAHGAGRGLRNQLRRAAACEGEVHWSSDSRGTRFVLWLPLVLQRGR